MLELGPGTGVVTEALIERGVAPERIIAIEYNPGFLPPARASAFPASRVVEGDAYDLDTHAAGRIAGPFSAVVSSLPLLTRPLEDRAAPASRRARPHGARRPLHPVLLFARPPVQAVAGRFTVERVALGPA